MLRAFRDSQGLEWRVWDVLPGAAANTFSMGFDALAAAKGDYAKGWLCFESTAQKRRLAPIPAGWDDSADTELERLCANAAAVPARRRHGDEARTSA
jgi:hypothetical protein